MIRSVRTATGPAGPVEEIVEASDSRSVDGIPLAHRIVTTRGGEAGERITIEAFELNPEVDEELFENPQASATVAP